MRSPLILVSFFLLALTVGCTAVAGGEGPTPTPAPSVPAGAIDCGVEERKLGQDRNLPSRDCLIEAYNAGKTATWLTTLPTVEGDPISFRVVILGPGAIEVTVDNTQDRFSAPEDRKVETRECTALAVETATLPPTFKLTGCSGHFSSELRI